MSCALVIIRLLWLSSVVDALWNKSMGELYVCQDRRGRVSVCVCVCTQPPTLAAAAALWLSSVHFSWAV